MVVDAQTLAAHRHIRAAVVLDLLARQERSQGWLARRMGIHPSLLTRVLKGERSATPEFRRRLSEALDLPEVVLFSDMPMHMDTAPAASEVA
jgi:transcriptional regulator with XRE-family HTH domain